MSSQDVSIEMGAVGPSTTVSKSSGADAGAGGPGSDLQKGSSQPGEPGAEGAEGTGAEGEDAEPVPEEKYKPRCEKLMKVYLCTFMGHEYHFTEFLCLVAFAGCVLAGVYVMYDGKLDTRYFAIFLMVYALFGLIFVWDFATIASLADLANQLDGVRQRADVENCKYALINNALEDQTKLYGEQLGVLGDESKAIREEVKKFEDQLQKLHDTQKVQEKLLNIQIELGDAENRFARIMQASSIDREKELKKNALNLLFTERAGVFGTAGMSREGMLPRTDETVKVLEQFWINQKIDPENKFRSEFKKLLKEPILMNHKFIALADKAMRTRVFRLRTVKERLAAKTKVLEKRKREAQQLAQKFQENIEALKRGEDEKHPGLVYDPEADKREEREEMRKMNVFADGTDSEEDIDDRPNFAKQKQEQQAAKKEEKDNRKDEKKEEKVRQESTNIASAASPVPSMESKSQASGSIGGPDAKAPPKLPPKTVTIHRDMDPDAML